MASIYKRASGYWYIKFKADGRWIYRSLGVKTRRAAEQAKRNFLASEFAPSPDEQITWDRLWPLYDRWARAHLSRRTIETRLWAIGSWRRHSTKNQPATVTLQDVEAFKTAMLEAGRTPNTVNCALRGMQAFLSRCQKQGWYDGPNPWAQTEQVRVTRRLPVWLDGDDMGRVLTVAEEHGREAHLLFALGIFAGMRKQEITDARWDWIDWARSTIAIQGKGSKRRVVPLHQRLREILQLYRQESGWIVAPHCQPGRDRYRYDPVKLFRAVANAAGVPHITPHVLRHTFASQLVSAGVDLFKVQKWLGHSSPVTTQIYAHLREADDDINRF